MRVIVDTPIWSEFLRRSTPISDVYEALKQLIIEGDALLLGCVRQEILSGVSQPRQFEKLKTALRAFPDVELEVEDYELAAEFFNKCRTGGIQGSNTDFLLAAVSARRATPIFTLDKDFELYSNVLPVQLFAP
jgi:predicted nucleic acid-binding protein